ncbi:late secretory pathway protein AVL9 homolog [Ictalurus furcatus]|uniref:late secretory pathway protein AVL9 homolog n=1 Tax=Ictalurus furcatus TaxID=66913 RepID=UPI002350B167|nr:late secretory pathway protein AVL9 homolog [Ictalurus furcatus]
MESGGKDEVKGAVLHIVVVGFHHKRGCQVEFSYPPISDEGHDSNSLPDQWKYLPFLALPDGAHNYQEDTVYFLLPPLSEEMKCVYGVSCYRQIEAKALKVRQADVTRETVQKSVCVLSRVPVFGLIAAKLQLITHAYFEEKDFSQISILKELYDHMNGSLRFPTLEGSQVYLGLSARDLILHFKHKVLVLFKLILLEKKVLFYVSPVNRLVGTLMTVLSLFPGMIERGLPDSSHYHPKSSQSETTDIIKSVDLTQNTEVFVAEPAASQSDGFTGTKANSSPPDWPDSEWESLDPSVLEEEEEQDGGRSAQAECIEPESNTPITVQPKATPAQTAQHTHTDTHSDAHQHTPLLEEDRCGLPLAIFTKGYLCLPYMALQQHHLLCDVRVRGFVAGATNILFRQQRHLSDAIVDVEEGVIHIADPELRRVLSLTTADLRFCDFLLKSVSEHSEDVFLDGTGWEGGDEWIRAQFTHYMHTLLASTLQQDNEKLLADYGSAFISTWRVTHNYRAWSSTHHPTIAEVTPGHPFQGQYSVADVKLRFSHSVQNSERGRRLGSAVMSTSRSVVQTGRAVGQSVGGALNSAKTVMSSWFSTLSQPALISNPQSTTTTKQ